jgi:hypothetical protein
MITVVSGLPRSGTSLMMQMISAGGMPVLTDGLRSADDNNPKGYLEWEAAKSLPKNPELIAGAEGKVVKIISALLFSLPAGYEYRVVFMRRPLEEIVASQDKMFQRLGKEVPPASNETVFTAFQQHLTKVKTWLSQQSNISVLYVDYAAAVQNPREEAGKISQFLGLSFDVDAMARQVMQSLHREKAKT